MHVEQSADESEDVGWAADPGFDVNVDEVLIPLKKVIYVGQLLDISPDDFPNIEAQSHSY